jgi:hypothetical protein
VVSDRYERREGTFLTVQRLITMALTCAVAALALGCGRPPLNVSTSARAVVIDMQTLGEYPTDVDRLRLTDATDKRVVWEVKGRDEPQLGRVTLSIGENGVAVADVRHGAYDVLAPAAANTFKIEARKRYIVEVWGKDDVSRTKRQVEFTVPGA